MIYLDNAATSWPKPECVYKASDFFLRSCGSSGRGNHIFSRSANYILYETRKNISKLFAIRDPSNIAFFLNATDAINTAIFGIFKKNDTIITTSMEHNAISRPLRELEKRGSKIVIIPCKQNGQLPIEIMKSTLKDGARAIIMSHASNITGGINPIEEISYFAKKFGALLFIDAAQTAGVENINVENLGIDILAFSGHKGLMGPPGTAGLYIREGINCLPLRFGGTGSNSEKDTQPNYMPDMLESGTANISGIAGLNEGIKFILNTNIKNIKKKEIFLFEALIDKLKNFSEITMYGLDSLHHICILSFNIAGIDSGLVAYLLDKKYNIACRAGLHCSPWAHNTLGTINTGTVRLSLGFFNCLSDITETTIAIKDIIKNHVV